jgi:hypothetical protein
VRRYYLLSYYVHSNIKCYEKYFSSFSKNVSRKFKNSTNVPFWINLSMRAVFVGVKQTYLDTKVTILNTVLVFVTIYLYAFNG